MALDVPQPCAKGPHINRQLSTVGWGKLLDILHALQPSRGAAERSHRVDAKAPRTAGASARAPRGFTRHSIGQSSGSRFIPTIPAWRTPAPRRRVLSLPPPTRSTPAWAAAPERSAPLAAAASSASSTPAKSGSKPAPSRHASTTFEFVGSTLYLLGENGYRPSPAFVRTRTASSSVLVSIRRRTRLAGENVSDALPNRQIPLRQHRPGA